MDGPGDDHTKWTKSKKDKYHMISLIFKILKKWIYLQKIDRCTDVKNKLMGIREENYGEMMYWESVTIMYTLLYLREITDK